MFNHCLKTVFCIREYSTCGVSCCQVFPGLQSFLFVFYPDPTENWESGYNRFVEVHGIGM